MDNYKEKRSGGYSQKNAGRERSFENNFNGEFRKKQRPRFSRDNDARNGYVRVEKRDNGFGGEERFNKYGKFGGNTSFRSESGRMGRNNPEERGYPQKQYNREKPARFFQYNNDETSSYNAIGGGKGYGKQNRNTYGKKGEYEPNAKYSNKKRIQYREATLDPDAPLRLNKYLANAGICSRREADNYITAGLISVNGAIVTELGTKVTPADDVRFNGERVNPERKVYVLLNKPKDCVTTVDDPQERRTVLDCLKGVGKERIYPVGRLDRNTTGVLLLTNDGDMASRLTHPKYMKKKIYHVTCDKNVAMSDMDLLVTGLELEDGRVYADEVSYVNDADRSQIGIEIHSGKNRIVRRMMEHLGYRVMKLDRVLFAGLTKKNLKRGDWRYLTEKEVTMLRMGAYE